MLRWNRGRNRPEAQNRDEAKTLPGHQRSQRLLGRPETGEDGGDADFLGRPATSLRRRATVLVLAEIRDTPDPDRQEAIEGLAADFEVLAITPEAEILVDAYLAHGVFTEKTRNDGTHVAIAVTHGIQYLASWNFRHLVKVTKRRQVNLVNALEGYQPIEIVAPPLL
jgi:hypothetical protein